MPATFYALLPNMKKGLFFAMGEGSRIFVACFLPGTQQRPNVFVSDAWPAPATYHRSFCENCDQRVGRSPKRARPVRFHGAVVGFVHRCLSRTRNLAASSKHLAELFSGWSRPKIGPGFFFSGFLKNLNFFFEDLCS